MEQRCSKLNHDMDTCNSDIGEYNRCVWSHGVNYNAKSKSHKRAVIAEEVGMEAVSKGSSYNKHHDVDSKEMKKEEITARLGCIWDQTGCAAGCDMEAMDARCDRMSHDQELCEGEIGQFNRCTWSHGSNAHMNVDIRFADIGEDSTLDILLIVAGVVTTLFIIHQFYRWFRNRDYHKLQGLSTQHHEEIQITSHAV